MKKLSGEEANNYIREHYLTRSDEELAKHCRLTPNAVQCRRYAMKLIRPPYARMKTGPQPKPEPTPDEALRSYTDKKTTRQDKRTLNRLLEAHEALKRDYEAATALRTTPLQTHVIEAPRAKDKTGETTIVALFSDVHLEEEVRPEMTNGLGGYTVEIAKARVDQYFRTLLRLIQLEQQAVKIDHLVLAMLGDYISNDIHDELMETCKLRPMNAINSARNWIATGIQYLLDNSKLKITIVCHSGNHARTTKKTHHSTEPGHSLEWLMYTFLADYFSHEKRLTWVIPEGYLSYLQIYDKTIRFSHGHNVKYGGGVGGLTIPLNKAIAQWNRARTADIDCLGHFHQVFDGGNFVVNGSVIGYSPFAIAIKAAYEPPAQVLFAVHSRYGKYMTRTIKFT